MHIFNEIALSSLSGNLESDPSHSWTGFTLGQHAVHVFFVVSGTLVTMSLLQSKSLARFFLSRALRIFPGLLACITLTAFVLGPFVSGLPLYLYFASPDAPLYVVKTFSLATAKAALPLFETLPMAGEINLSLWTLKYEVLCYVLLGLAACVGFSQATHLRRLLLLLTSLLMLSYLVPEFPKPETPLDNLRRFLICFGLGSLVYLYRQALAFSYPRAAIAALVAYLLSATPLGTPFLLAATTLLAFAFSLHRYGAFSRAAEKMDLSYGVYLYGWPVAQTVLLLAPAISLVTHQSITLAMTLLLAAASWVAVERPALRLKSRIWRWPSASTKQASESWEVARSSWPG